MKIIFTAIILLILSVSVVFAEAPKDVDGWRQAKWGMTEDEVLQAFKGEAVKYNEPKNELSTIYTPIIIKNINLGNDVKIGSYNARFAFDKENKKLVCVTIEKYDHGKKFLTITNPGDYVLAEEPLAKITKILQLFWLF